MSDWQDISTAPKNGAWIIALVTEPFEDGLPKPWVYTTRWIVCRDEWWEQVSDTRKELRTRDTSHWEGYETPSHWMPLKEPT